MLMTSSPPHLLHPKYRPDIDGLRAVAVLGVVGFHAFPDWGGGGFTGVDIFFVISGYLISTIIFENLDKDTFSFREFYARRIRRIFPALILTLVACFAFGWFALLADEFRQLGKHIAGGAGFIANFIFMNEAGYFDNTAGTKPLLHLWSLGIEEQFYIVWPFALWVARKRKFSLPVLIVLVAASFLVNIWEVKWHAVAAFYSPQTRFWELSSGSLLAWVVLYKKDAFASLKGGLARYPVSDMLSFVGLAFLACGFWRIDKDSNFPGAWALLPVLGTVCLISGGSRAWFNRHILSNRFAVRLGLISFPLYLWHWPLLSFARIIEGGFPARNIRIAAVIASIALAWLTYELVERPVRFGGHARSKVIVLVALMTVVGGIGFATYRENGWGSRFGNYEMISAAVDDWGYPKGLHAVSFEGIPVYLNASDNPDVVLFGDSHLEQYGPRIVELTSRGEAKNVAFITGGGCPPIPDVFESRHPECAGLAGKFLAYLKEHPAVKDVVIAACFNCYFIDQAEPLSSPEDTYHYYYKDGSLVEPFRGGDGMNAAMKGLADFAASLRKKYKVYVLMDNPDGDNFDPKSMLNSYNGRRPLFLSRSYRFNPGQFPRDPREIALEDELTKRLSPTGAIVLDQAELVCPENVCAAVDETGRPIYKDRSHMRPFFVKKKMNVLDAIIARRPGS